MADNLSKAGRSLGWVSALDVEGRTIWIVDAHREGKRFVITADEKLTAFLEREKQNAENCSTRRNSYSRLFRRGVRRRYRNWFIAGQ